MVRTREAPKKRRIASSSPPAPSLSKRRTAADRRTSTSACGTKLELNVQNDLGLARHSYMHTNELMASYTKNPHPAFPEIARLMGITGLSRKQVSSWFWRKRGGAGAPRNITTEGSPQPSSKPSPIAAPSAGVWGSVISTRTRRRKGAGAESKANRPKPQEDSGRPVSNNDLDNTHETASPPPPTRSWGSGPSSSHLPGLNSTLCAHKKVTDWRQGSVVATDPICVELHTSAPKLETIVEAQAKRFASSPLRLDVRSFPHQPQLYEEYSSGDSEDEIDFAAANLLLDFADSGSNYSPSSAPTTAASWGWGHGSGPNSASCSSLRCHKRLKSEFEAADEYIPGTLPGIGWVNPGDSGNQEEDASPDYGEPQFVGGVQYRPGQRFLEWRR